MNSREAPTTAIDETGVASPRVEQIGVQSVEVAGRLLKALATLDGPQTLTALSAAAGLPPAKAHRYLVSLIREGFIEQSAADGRYDFGGAARLIGRVAMNRLDIVRIGTPLLSKLRDDLRETVFMGLWTPQGPMVIEWFDIVRPVSVVIRPGSILPIHTSALGSDLRGLSGAGDRRARHRIGRTGGDVAATRTDARQSRPRALRTSDATVLVWCRAI